ncbi:hypothetical protein HSB1_23780 [Halogranum salarium B-1]|uniref:Uncharacterized protein n=1 Tax=Halogranum salarium B-1 TaxID=1210908 RepID=J3EW03_9EURY|nr:hypothetical protein HSB1_23780 [Halogranum salarium B-1]
MLLTASSTIVKPLFNDCRTSDEVKMDKAGEIRRFGQR